jgi:hypothetical protein
MGQTMKRLVVVVAILAVVLAQSTASTFAQTKDQYLKAAPGAQTPPPPPQPAAKAPKKGTTLCQPPGASKPQPC